MTKQGAQIVRELVAGVQLCIGIAAKLALAGYNSVAATDLAAFTILPMNGH